MRSKATFERLPDFLSAALRSEGRGLFGNALPVAYAQVIALQVIALQVIALQVIALNMQPVVLGLHMEVSYDSLKIM